MSEVLRERPEVNPHTPRSDSVSERLNNLIDRDYRKTSPSKMRRVLNSLSSFFGYKGSNRTLDNLYHPNSTLKKPVKR